MEEGYKLYKTKNNIPIQYKDNSKELTITINNFTKTFQNKIIIENIFDKKINDITYNEMLSYLECGKYYTDQQLDNILDEIKNDNYHGVEYHKKFYTENFKAVKNIINKPLNL